MEDRLPLLVFPSARMTTPPKGRGFPSGKPHLPDHARQVERLTTQLADLQHEFSRYKASISDTVGGLEPETVLIIEIAGSVEDFKQAVEATDGLEWLGEWDIEDIDSDDDFYERNKRGVRTDKRLRGRLFLSLGNEQGLRELLALWERWDKGQGLPYGKAKWRDVFNQTLKIRRWGIEETLRETGMIDHWHDLLNSVDPDQTIHFQIDLFYRQDPEKRKQNEVTISVLLAELGGRTLGKFIDMQNIAFHAAKAELPAGKIRDLLHMLESPSAELDIQLFIFPGVMYFRPTGQSLVSLGDDPGIETEFPEGRSELPPVVAILDGAPNLQHKALKGRLLLDDPDNLSGQYQPGERRHGTAMASLVVHGDLSNGSNAPLTRQVYHLPVMQPNVDARSFGKYDEHFPDEVFFEDRIERAVRRMFEGEGNTQAQAPNIKIINISIGDPARPFIHTPSPWARLLDWLSWKYHVLFCVSAGNFKEGIDVGMPNVDFSQLTDEQKVTRVLQCIAMQLTQRRLLSPAESLNALTIGALHTDESGSAISFPRIDLLPNRALFSPVSRFGYGFRRSIKPEVLFPGGQQLYATPPLDKDQNYSIDTGLRAPGQQVAWDSAQEGDISRTVYTRGTSNAAALATRSGARIYEVLSDLQAEHGEQIDDGLMAALIKTLLVHGAQHSNQAEKALSTSLKNSTNSRRFKEVMARYIGYGAVNIERVLACTEQRGTVLGSGTIRADHIHEYRFPLPSCLSEVRIWRRMVVTLAWFSPINPAHRNLREAKLSFQSVGKWGELPLKLKRMDSDYNQVLRGTVQHEVLEGEEQIAAYEEGGCILLQVTCKADATEKIDQAIPYGLAVTLEVTEGINIPIYEQIRARIKQQVIIGASLGSP